MCGIEYAHCSLVFTKASLNPGFWVRTHLHGNVLFQPKVYEGEKREKISKHHMRYKEAGGPSSWGLFMEPDPVAAFLHDKGNLCPTKITFKNNLVEE